jgi:hypothetical protein
VPAATWSSSVDGKWPVSGKQFGGLGPTISVLAASAPTGAGPTTMLGWIGQPPLMGHEPFDGVVPFSCGASRATSGGGHGECRALNLLPTNAGYYARSSGADIMAVIPVGKIKVWAQAMNDKEHWHHIAAVDDGLSVTIYLDGALIAAGVKKPGATPSINTTPGFIIGGWADLNRCFAGWLAGVEFYHTTLRQTQVAAAMKRTDPAPRHRSHHR